MSHHRRHAILRREHIPAGHHSLVRAALLIRELPLDEHALARVHEQARRRGQLSPLLARADDGRRSRAEVDLERERGRVSACWGEWECRATRVGQGECGPVCGGLAEDANVARGDVRDKNEVLEWLPGAFENEKSVWPHVSRMASAGEALWLLTSS